MQQLRERVRKMSEKQLCRHQGQWRRRGRATLGTAADFSVGHEEDHGGPDCPSATHGETHQTGYPHGSLWRTLG